MAVLQTILARTVAGPETYSVGGRPVALLLWGNGQISEGMTDGFHFVIGMTDGVLQTTRAIGYADAAADPSGYQLDYTTHIYKLATTAGALRQSASLLAFTDDGFTLQWDTVDGVASRINVLAILEGEVAGCKMVRVFCDENPEIITGLGFAPTAIITIAESIDAVGGYLGTPFAAISMFGFSDGTNNGCVDTYARLSGLQTGNTALHTDTAGVVRYISSAFEGMTAVGVTPNTFGPDGFQVSKGGFGASSLLHSFLCLGGVTAKVGRVDQPAVAGTVDMGIPFDPSVVIVQGWGTTTTGDATAGSWPSLGAWTKVGSTVSAMAASHRPAATSLTAVHGSADVALRKVTPVDSGAASTVTANVVIVNNGHGAQFTVSDGATTRSFLYFALDLISLQPPEPVSNTRSFALHDPISAAPDLEAHPGRKEGRITQIGSIIRRSTDRLGGWQSSTCRWSSDDHDRLLRGLMRTNRFYGREFRVFLGDRRDIANSRCLGRFNIRSYPPTPEFGVDIEGTDVIGSEFSAFNLDRDILEGYVFDAERFPNAPEDLLKQVPPQPVPAYWGRWSDEPPAPISVEPPVFIGATWRGAISGSTWTGSAWTMGYGVISNPSAPIPANLTSSVVAGGTLDAAAHGTLYAQVWGVATDGSVGDPYPFLPGNHPITITGTGKKVVLTVTPGTGSPAKWRFALGSTWLPAIGAPYWEQIIEVPGGTTSVEFTHHPTDYSLHTPITPGAFRPTISRRWYRCVTRIGSSRSVATVLETRAAEWTPYYRPIHVSWTPVGGASSYELYYQDLSNLRPATEFNRRFNVPVQLDSDGFNWFEDDFIHPGEYVAGGIPAPGGMIPVLAGRASRGSWPPTDPGSQFRVGFAEMALINAGGVSPPPPATVASVCVPGGNVRLGVTPHNMCFAQVWAETGGLEGDPNPYVPEHFGVPITMDNCKIRISWTFAGTNPDHWRIALATEYYGARWNQVLEVPGTARFVEFTNQAWGDAGGLTPGATIPYWNRKEFTVQAVMPEGLTGTALPIGMHPYAGPYKRAAYLSWLPVEGALSYNVILAEVPVAYFGWTHMCNVSAEQIDADGLVYFIHDWNFSPCEKITAVPAPRGMIPVIDTGDVSFGGGDYAQLVIARYPWHKVLSVFAGETRLANNHPDLRHPDHPLWPLATRYVTIGGWDTTILYVRVGSDVLNKHRDGTATIRVNGCTTEDRGNGRGSTLTQAARVAQHVFQELVLNDHKTGLWAGIPLYNDGVGIINSLSFVNAELMQIQRIGGSGYTARVALQEPTTLRQVIEHFVQSFGLHFGINQHGQIVCGHYDDSVDPTIGYPHYRDQREIVGNIQIEPRTQELENRIPYQWDYRPETKTYFVVNKMAVNETSIADHLGKPHTGQLRSLPYAADNATVQDVITRLILLGAYVREWIAVPVSIVGFDNNVDLFKIISITDEEGTGATGYHEEFILVLEIEVVPPDPASDRPVVVVLKGLNITALADAAWVWGPDTIVDWDTMTPEEKGIYGAWADEDNKIPSTDDPAKEWR